jgi:hypothetical protein
MAAMTRKYRHIEQALIALFEVNDDRLPAFKARVRHLRTMGVPSIPKTGSGNQVEYLDVHAFQLALALELERIGLPPTIAVQYALQDELATILSAERASAHSIVNQADIYLALLPGHLGAEEPQRSVEISIYERGVDKVVGLLVSGASICAVNVSELLRSLDRNLMAVAP